MSKNKHIDPIPESFENYGEAAEFWEKHDTTDYPEAFRTVEVKSELRRRRYEIEIDADVIETLRTHARQKRTTPARLANTLLRRELSSVK